MRRNIWKEISCKDFDVKELPKTAFYKIWLKKLNMDCWPTKDFLSEGTFHGKYAFRSRK